MKALLTLVLCVVALHAAPPPIEPPARPPLGAPADARLCNNKWYRVYLQKGLSWHAARDRCRQLGGQLVTVPDAPTWAFILTLTKGPILWLGATDEETPGAWK